MIKCSVKLFFDALFEFVPDWDENYDNADSLYSKVLSFCKTHKSENGGIVFDVDEISFFSHDVSTKVISYIEENLSEDEIDPFELQLLIEENIA